MWGLSSPESIKNKNVHDFKTCRKTGLKESRSRKLGLCGCLHLLFIAGIQMDADSNHGCHERIMLLCVYEHTVQSVIIEDAVVDPFCGGALVIDLLISICAAGDIGVKPDIPFGPGLDNSPIFGISAGVFTFGTVFFPIGAAPHEVTAGTVITVRLHAQFFLT